MFENFNKRLFNSVANAVKEEAVSSATNIIPVILSIMPVAGIIFGLLPSKKPKIAMIINNYYYYGGKG